MASDFGDEMDTWEWIATALYSAAFNNRLGYGLSAAKRGSVAS